MFPVQLQTGPVQLPAFRLSPHLSDRQQASSVNLKPSEVRLSQPRPDAAPVPGEPGEPGGTTQPTLQRRDSEPGLRGILKKSGSGASEGGRTEAGQRESPLGHEQNGSGCEEAGTRRGTEGAERQELVAPPRRARRAASGGEGGSLPPWRQRARARRETIACTPARASPEQDALQEERNSCDKPQEQLLTTGERPETPR